MDTTVIDLTRVPQRIRIRGCTGSGKTTLCGKMSKLLDLPQVEMDELFWQPNWTETPDDEFATILEENVMKDKWVLAGNYSRTKEIIDPRTELTIWLCYSYSRNFWQLFKRTMRRGIKRELLWGHSRESLYKQFFSKKSIFLWFFKGYPTIRKKAYEQFENPPEGMKVLIFNHPKQTEEFLEKLVEARQSSAPIESS